MTLYAVKIEITFDEIKKKKNKFAAIIAFQKI